MKMISALGKVAVGALVVTFWGVAPGCGPSIGAYCDRVCDCTGCSATQQDDCVDTTDDVRRKADKKGCRSQFDDLLSCGLEELECKDGHAHIDGCESEQEAFLKCIADKPGGTGGFGGNGGYGEGGWDDGGYGGEGGYGEGGWGGYGGDGGYGGYGGYGGDGGYGGYGGSGGFGAGGSGGGGECVGCGEYISSDAEEICDGTSLYLYDQLVECVCAGPCQAVCDDNVCAAVAPSSACQACILNSNQGCGNEYAECANDI